VSGGMFEDDDHDAAEQASAPPRRSRALLITVGVLVALFLGFTGFSAFWTERLWFGSVGYQGVFSTLVRTKVGLFLVFGLLMALSVGVNLVLAFRFRPIFRPSSPEQVSLDRYREAVTPIRTWLLVGVSVVIGLFAGATASGKWREYLLWRNGVDFGRKDPYFHNDIGFYVFDLPWLHYLVDFTMAIAIISLIAAAVVHYLYGGIRLQSQHDRFSGPAAAQLSVLMGIFVLAKAADYWLDRFDLLNESGSLITGVTYTDDHAVLPARNILMFIALICAVLFLANVVLRTWLLPSVGLALLVLSSILLGLVWPGIVQQFQVEPSQADKENPYIKKNIEATRAAYDLEDSVVTPYSGTSTLTPAQQAEEIRNVPGIRLVDPALIKATFEQRQQVTRYYSVVGNPDVDRYQINGIDRDMVVAARELDQSGLPEDGKNWSNLHTVYTHGYGVIAAFGNQRDADNKQQTGSDDPAWAETDIPPRGELTDLTPDGYRGQIYFGENSPEYSIVGKPSPSADDVELDLPNGENEANSTTSTYTGQAGVEVGDLWHKMLYAWKFGEPNIVLSGRVNQNSKILYDRNPRQMVEKVAPWLTVDQDPFPAVVDGKIVWVLDGYTATDQYPLSQRGSFQEMTSDALDQGSEFRTLPTDEINYMRNAVKATVDAYDGTVTLYAWDEKDPLLKAWRSAFPDTVTPKSEIPKDLLEHMRYPEDLFKVQRYQLARYHVTNASDFYENNDRWEVAKDPEATGKLQPPYRLSVRTPSGSSEPVFSLTSVYTPYRRDNLASFVSVDADAANEDYGTLRVLTLPGNTQIPGPGQIANQFGSNTTIQNELAKLTRNANVRVLNGNLLTLPVGVTDDNSDGGLLYVQPLYAVRSGTSTANYPVLQYVLVSLGSRSGIGDTVAKAVANVLGTTLDETPTPPSNPTKPPSSGQPNNTQPASVIQLLRRADAQFKVAEQALADGDLAGYADATKRAERLVQRALAQAELPDEKSSGGN
jgi:uncharacterized membrane protein (UPF0182 family)